MLWGNVVSELWKMGEGVEGEEAAVTEVWRGERGREGDHCYRGVGGEGV